MDKSLEVNPEELFAIIGRQQVIIEKQVRALKELTELYNEKVKEIEEKSLGGLEQTHSH